jgi:hypothetical protein
VIYLKNTTFSLSHPQFSVIIGIFFNSIDHQLFKFNLHCFVQGEKKTNVDNEQRNAAANPCPGADDPVRSSLQLEDGTRVLGDEVKHDKLLSKDTAVALQKNENSHRFLAQKTFLRVSPQ